MEEHMSEQITDAVLENEQVAEMPKCVSCGQRHDKTVLKAYARQRSKWTHWYLCPVSGDPVMLKMETANAEHEPILDDIYRKLDEVSGSEYTIAVFQPQGDGHLCTQYTHKLNLEGKNRNGEDIPTELSKLLKDALSQISGPPQGRPPAGPKQVSPILDLFGESRQVEPAKQEEKPPVTKLFKD